MNNLKPLLMMFSIIPKQYFGNICRRCFEKTHKQRCQKILKREFLSYIHINKQCLQWLRWHLFLKHEVYIFNDEDKLSNSEQVKLKFFIIASTPSDPIIGLDAICKHNLLAKVSSLFGLVFPDIDTNTESPLPFLVPTHCQSCRKSLQKTYCRQTTTLYRSIRLR